MNVTKIVTRCQIFHLKRTKFILFWLGICPRTSWGSSQRSPDLLAIDLEKRKKNSKEGRGRGRGRGICFIKLRG